MRHDAYRWAVEGVVAAVLLALGAMFGCSDKSTGSAPGWSYVKGHVEGGAGAVPAGATRPLAVRGAEVRVAIIQSNGLYREVSPYAATSGPDGAYVAATTQLGVRGLIVLADKGSDEYRGILSALTTDGDTVAAPPLSGESTVEADVFARIVAHGAVAQVSLADIGGTVTVPLASAIQGNAGQINLLAQAIETDGETQAATFQSSAFGVTAAEWDAIRARRDAARAELDRELEVAGNDPYGISGSYHRFYTDEANAFATHGVVLADCARGREVAAQAFLKVAATLRPDVALLAAKSAGAWRTRLMPWAVREAFYDLRVEQALLNHVIEADMALSAAVAAAGSTAEILAAFDAYNAAIIGYLKQALPALATPVEVARGALLAAGGPRAVLRGAVSAAGSSDAVVDAYLAYFGTALAAVNAALAETEATPLEMETIRTVLVLGAMPT